MEQADDMTLYIKAVKESFWLWKCEGKPVGLQNYTYSKLKENKKILRSEQRKKSAFLRTEAIDEIMNTNPSDSKLFSKLVNNQRKSKSNSAIDRMSFGGNTAKGDDLIYSWAEYFGELATPKTNSIFDEKYKESAIIQNNIL